MAPRLSRPRPASDTERRSAVPPAALVPGPRAAPPAAAGRETGGAFSGRRRPLFFRMNGTHRDSREGRGAAVPLEQPPQGPPGILQSKPGRGPSATRRRAGRPRRGPIAWPPPSGLGYLARAAVFRDSSASIPLTRPPARRGPRRRRQGRLTGCDARAGGRGRPREMHCSCARFFCGARRRSRWRRRRGAPGSEAPARRSAGRPRAGTVAPWIGALCASRPWRRYLRPSWRRRCWLRRPQRRR